MSFVNLSLRLRERIDAAAGRDGEGSLAWITRAILDRLQASEEAAGYVNCESCTTIVQTDKAKFDPEDAGWICNKCLVVQG
jgi:hypothetical protein